ncbi:alpha/beta hydrolase [Acinetobacter sp. ANC 4173]|uniref:alpha/beta hydrolase n=1 Tax=Acinetobacter sp. ANC 4173 TaxID=2529837 RepID=UPI00103C0861|nr:alpha/beta hydrolase [Acinetobacter sp. ANC 4173]
MIYAEVQAKPNLAALTTNIAEQGSAYYQFQVKYFQSADQQRRYKVWLGLPRQATGASPALFMLDGNSVMSYLSEDVLQQLATREAPVLVAIGYDTNLPFDTTARALDYTPTDETGKITADPRQPERLSGGSAEFRKVLLSQIQPWVAGQAQLDPQRQALWGHSYGGLFVLDSLMHAQYFSHYFAASPSLSWADARILKNMQTKAVSHDQTQALWIMEGDLAQNHPATKSPNFNPNTVQDNRHVIAHFVQQGVQSKLLLYPNLSHGQMFAASLLDILNYRLF